MIDTNTESGSPELWCDNECPAWCDDYEMSNGKRYSETLGWVNVNNKDLCPSCFSFKIAKKLDKEMATLFLAGLIKMDPIIVLGFIEKHHGKK